MVSFGKDKKYSSSKPKKQISKFGKLKVKDKECYQREDASGI